MVAHTKPETKHSAATVAAHPPPLDYEKPPAPPPHDPGPIYIYRRVKWLGDGTDKEIMPWYGTDFVKGEETSLEHLPLHQARELITAALHNPDQFEVI